MSSFPFFSRLLVVISIVIVASGAFAFSSLDETQKIESAAAKSANFGRLVVKPAKLAFKPLNYSSKKPQPSAESKTFSIQNGGKGTDTLMVTVGAITGPNASEFQISPPSGTFGLAPGKAASSVFTVTYTPMSDGRATAQIDVSAVDAGGTRGPTMRTIKLSGSARGPIPIQSATATATPTASPTPGSGQSGKNSADAPGVIVNGNTVTAYFPLGSYGFSAPDILKSVIEGPNPSPSPVTYTADHVSSCAVAQSGEAVCAEGNSQAIAQFDLIPAGSATTTVTMVPTTSQGAIDYLPGECSGCGIVVDGGLGTGGAGLAIMSASAGLFTLDLGDNLATPIGITTNPSEPPGANFGYDVKNHLILNANYQLTMLPPSLMSTDPHFQIINISNPASPQVFDLSNDQSFFLPGTPNTTCTGNNLTDNDNQYPETTAIDENTRIAYVSFHTPPDCVNTPPDTIALFDLSQATFTPGNGGVSGTWDTAGKQIQSLAGDFALNGVDVMSVESTNHLAILAGGSAGFGAMQLPATSGTGTPAIVDWVSANLPNDPDGTPWNGWSAPNGVTTYVSPTANKSMALMVNALENGSSQRTGIARYAALVDIQALLLLPRDQVGGHQVAAANDGPALVTAGVVKFILIQ